MLYGKISDFLSDWKNDSESTLKIFKRFNRWKP